MSRDELIKHLREIGASIDAERNECKESMEKLDMDVMYLHSIRMYRRMCVFQEEVYKYLLEEVQKELEEI